jgi:hypothetical protein
LQPSDSRKTRIGDYCSLVVARQLQRREGAWVDALPKAIDLLSAEDTTDLCKGAISWTGMCEDPIEP